MTAAASPRSPAPPTSILIATANAGKVREFRQMLGDEAFRWSDLGKHRDLAPPQETGRTFRANACLKATYYASRLKTWALADDSGLAVDPLDGSPGVLSARWAEINGSGSGDADNNALLLRQLHETGLPQERWTARFVCVLALSDPDGRILFTVEDAVAGRVIRQPRGSNGFGYDPLFLVPELGKTTAELPPEQKHRISHRGKALHRLRKLLESIELR
jgi:XTP/dITP diphosphohydrolase